MRPAWIAVLLSLLGVAYLRVGTPSVRAYPSPDGTMVLKLTLSRAPNFVAYVRSGGRAALRDGDEPA